MVSRLEPNAIVPYTPERARIVVDPMPKALYRRAATRSASNTVELFTLDEPRYEIHFDNTEKGIESAKRCRFENEVEVSLPGFHSPELH